MRVSDVLYYEECSADLNVGPKFNGNCTPCFVIEKAMYRTLLVNVWLCEKCMLIVLVFDRCFYITSFKGRYNMFQGSL